MKYMSLVAGALLIVSTLSGCSQKASGMNEERAQYQRDLAKEGQKELSREQNQY